MAGFGHDERAHVRRLQAVREPLRQHQNPAVPFACRQLRLHLDTTSRTRADPRVATVQGGDGPPESVSPRRSGRAPRERSGRRSTSRSWLPDEGRAKARNWCPERPWPWAGSCALSSGTHAQSARRGPARRAPGSAQLRAQHCAAAVRPVGGPFWGAAGSGVRARRRSALRCMSRARSRPEAGSASSCLLFASRLRMAVRSGS